MNANIKPNPIPMEMQRKLDRILSMDIAALTEAYLIELDRQKLTFPDRPPTLDLMYKLLIPELFVLAEEYVKKTGKTLNTELIQKADDA